MPTRAEPNPFELMPSAAESQAPKEIKKYSSTLEKPYPTITKPTVFTHQPWGLREKRWEIFEKNKKQNKDGEIV